jgi:plastocyanin
MTIIVVRIDFADGLGRSETEMEKSYEFTIHRAECQEKENIMRSALRFVAPAVFTAAMILALSPLAFATDFEVEIENFAFVPHGTHINVGDTVSWRNRDGVTHTATSDDGVFNSGPLALDQRYSFVFISAGSYPYHCAFHLSMRDTIFVAPQTGVDENSVNTPRAFELAQNYPNPFNARTVIGYSLTQPAHVTVEVFNVLGQKVETLFDERQDAGTYQVTWDAAKQNSGVFFYRLTALDQTKTGRMTLLK